MRFFLSLVLLAIACPAWSQSGDAEKSKGPVYFPLKVGYQWHYRIVGSPVVATWRVGKIEEINGQQVALMEKLEGNQVTATQSLSHGSTGIFSHRVNGMEISPPVQWLKFPVKKGESWKGEVPMAGLRFKVLYRVADFEQIHVPFGKFATVKIQVDAEVAGTKISATYWLSKDVGVVKQTIEAAGNKVTLELDSFEKGK